jgi:hypothetical protein
MSMSFCTLFHRTGTVGAMLFILAALLEAKPARTAVKGTPTVGGREVARFVLLERLKVDRSGPGMTYSDLADRISCVVLAGQFIPVSEDAQGVYYQGSNGIKRLIKPTNVVDGGIYVSKTRPDGVFVYEGDARDQGSALKVDTYRLARSDIAKLLVGQVQTRGR